MQEHDARPIADHLLPMRDGRKLEVREYGDPAGHPALFFHGLIGSHHQASYIDAQARRHGLRIIAPNRPGVGRSDFIARGSALDAIPDVQDLAEALGLGDFSVIGISGGTPYALAALYRLADRVRTATVISGMGPTRLPGGLIGMDRRRRLVLEVGSRSPSLAWRAFAVEAGHFRADPVRVLDRLVATWAPPDRRLFERREVFDLFLLDLHAVFGEGSGATTLAHELSLYRNYGVPLEGLPANTRVVLWQGLGDTIVPPSMAFAMARAIPNCEAHFVPGGHFVALEIADQIIARLMHLLDAPARVAPAVAEERP